VALKGYFGPPGSGKTYEVVENVILPALAKGRRVVTNIAGFDYEGMCDYLVGKGFTREKLGTIQAITLNDDTAGKFAVIVGDGETAYLDEEKSIVRGGDMVVLDEVWRVWEEGKKLHPDDARFLRMHRHLAHKETHITCDIALIAQNYVDVHRRVRSLIEERYEMSKHIALGMRNRYRVSIYTKGARIPHQRLQKKYQSEVFDLYKSHSMGSAPGKEVEVDGRGNIFRGALFTIGLPAALVALGFGVWGVNRFFFPAGSTPKPTAKVDQAKAAPGTTPPPNPVPEATAEDKLSAWRVTGYASDGKDAILFIDVGGRAMMQRVADSKAIIAGQYVQTELDGKQLGTFTGIAKKRDNAGDLTR